MSENAHPPGSPDAVLPSTQGLFFLLEQVANRALAARGADGGEERGTVRVAALGLYPSTPGRIALRIQVRGRGRMLDGDYPLHLILQDTGPERTRFRLEIPREGGRAALLGLGMKALSGQLLDSLLNQALGGVLGGALAVEGELLVLHHRRLVSPRPAAP